MQANIIKDIQLLSNPILDYFFIVITLLGSSGFYFLLLPIFYWCIDKRFGLKLGLMLISSIYVNTVIKEVTMLSRPIGYPGIRSIFTQSAGGYSFPSGHAQGSATLWGTIMVHYKNKTINIVGITLVLLISLSRLYLGVHWPMDIVGGIFIALLIVFVGELTDSIIIESKIDIPFRYKILLSLLIPIILIILFPYKDNFEYMGIMSGVLLGYFIDQKYFGFTVENILTNHFIKLIIGIVIFFSLQTGLKLIFPYTNIFNMIRYGATGLWMSLGAPWVFYKLKLCSKTVN
ncbi:MAG: phosphatase PAP2 family protein [Thermoanaerobacteraceae bacterium]|nr:phosphatase PAP2 family protein [Thermoanaerobacteraceae bacterium]